MTEVLDYYDPYESAHVETREYLNELMKGGAPLDESEKRESPDRDESAQNEESLDESQSAQNDREKEASDDESKDI